jgi:hypothetical protein
MASNASAQMARGAWFRACLGLCTQWQERVTPANGGYWQVFGLKKQARVVCHALSRRTPLRMLEGVFSRIIRVA